MANQKGPLVPIRPAGELPELPAATAKVLPFPMPAKPTPRGGLTITIGKITVTRADDK
jgi:hypothetical protein